MRALVSALIVGVLVLLYWLLYLYRRRGEAMQDLITGLPSRDYFERYLQNCIIRATRNQSYRFGVLLLDIEGFAALRKRVGRFTAEETLADFAQRLYGILRPSDVLCRLDGDSFAVLLEDVRGNADVPRVAVRMHNSMKDIVTLASIELDVHVRIGVTISQPGVVAEAKTLLAQARTALERAVEMDRAYSVFDQELERTSASHLQLEAELAEAVLNNEIELRFQPLVDSRTKALIGFTALARWSHPERGLLQAREFIEIAETSRQILQIGEWVIDAAIQSLETLIQAARGPLVLTLNVGALEMERGGVGEKLARALAGRRLLAECLRVEVPAQVLLKESAAVDSAAERMSELGIGLHIDKAGTTSVPLWRAIKLGVRGARVDLSELQGADAETVGRIIAACRSIATEIVVEGVETEQLEEFVRSLDPPVWAEGYQIAHPLSFDDAIDVARARRV